MIFSRTNTRVQGFTTIELMLSVTVVAILSAVAFPSLRDFMSDHRSRSVMNQLIADLNLARLEAVKRNARVSVCPRSGTTTNCLDSTNWATGWIVCYDVDADGTCDAAPGDGSDPNPMKVTNAIDGVLTLASNVNKVSFTPVGAQSTATAVCLALNGTWTGAASRTATVAATGAISSKKNASATTCP